MLFCRSNRGTLRHQCRHSRGQLKNWSSPVTLFETDHLFPIEYIRLPDPRAPVASLISDSLLIIGSTENVGSGLWPEVLTLAF